VLTGNYVPCWAPGPNTYPVLGRWPESLWKARKLSYAQYDEYLFACRDGVVARKRNLDACREREAEKEESAEIEAQIARVKSNPDRPWQVYPQFPEVLAWLSVFWQDLPRYPFLLIVGPSQSGKTEWAKSLFKRPHEVKIGNLTYFPDMMRQFDRKVHDGLVLDDVRDLAFLSDHQEKLQGKYDAPIEFGNTPGGKCRYFRNMFKIPVAVTTNYDTKGLERLHADDFLGNPDNREVVYLDGPVV